MPGAAPVSPEEETPDVVEVISEALASIPKLKGQVWIGGDILLNPESVTPDGDWTVTLWLENPVDKATISNYLRKNLPELYGRVEYRAGEPSGEEPAMPVGGPMGLEQAPEGVSPLGEMPGLPEMGGV